jgi:hypothetical protein
MIKKKKFKSIKKDFNIILGSALFILLIGSAFAIDWLFGVFFIIGFTISILNKTLEKKPLIPILIFIGGLIVRVALFIVLPRVLESKDYWSLGIAGILFAILLIIGWKIQRGKV